MTVRDNQHSVLIIIFKSHISGGSDNLLVKGGTVRSKLSWSSGCTKPFLNKAR